MIGCAYSRGQWSNDFANPLRRHADVLGKAVLRQAQWLEEFFFKHLARGYRLSRLDFLVFLLAIDSCRCDPGNLNADWTSIGSQASWGWVIFNDIADKSSLAKDRSGFAARR